jgi:glutathione S-transferase
MKLYYYEASNPRKACAVAKYLGLEPEYVRVDLQAGEQRRPAYLVINPNGKVPALVDGEVGVWESTAIMMYLSARAGAQLWPDSTAGQATVLQWLAWPAVESGHSCAPALADRYIMIAVDSQTLTSPSTNAGTLPFGLIAR